MNRKGIAINTMTYLIIGILFLVLIGGSPLRDKIGEFANELIGWLNINYGGDDKIAGESVQALACAVDIAAYYGADGPPDNGAVDFTQFLSCSVTGELKAPTLIDTPYLDTPTGDESPITPQPSDPPIPPVLTGPKIACGGIDYYLSATEVVPASAKIKIAYPKGTDKIATLAPFKSCTESKNDCFIHSSDYTDKKPYKGIEANIASINGKTVSLKVRCPADDVVGAPMSVTGAILSSTPSTGVSFSQSVIDVTKSLGDKITGWAAGDVTPNKKCFGGKDKRCVVCETKESKFSCTVQAFELPQKISTEDGVFSTVTDFAKAWTGFVGEPYYLAYYETFPKELAGAWTYDAYDIALSAIAVGAVMNAGGGLINAAGSATWSGGKKAVNIFLNRQGMVTALKEGGVVGASAFEERIALEYGGKKALEKVLASKAASSMIGNEGTKNIINNEIEKSVLIKVKGSASSYENLNKVFDGDETIESLSVGQAQLMIAFNNLLMSSKVITSENIDELFTKGGLRTETNEILRTISDKDALKKELNTLRTAIKTDLNDAGENALKTGIDKGLRNYIDDSDALEAYAKKTVAEAYKKENKGAFARARLLLGSKALDNEKKALLEKEIDEVAEMTYVDVMRSYNSIKDPSLKGKFIDRYVTAWDTVPLADVDKAEMSLGKERAAKILENIPVTLNTVFGASSSEMNMISNEKKQKIVAIVLGASIIGMSQHTLEKYETTCDEKSLCLHKPSLITSKSGLTDPKSYGSQNNIPYSLKNIDEVASGGLVMLKYSGWISTNTVRFYLASPCKADLAVEAGKCQCANNPLDATTYTTGTVPGEYILRQNIKTGKIVNLMECEKSFFSDSFASLTHEYNCITVAPDITSINDYSNDAPNYCFENPLSTTKLASAGCTVGAVAATIGATFFSGGATLPVVLTMGGIGGLEGLCAELTRIESRWPNTQY